MQALHFSGVVNNILWSRREITITSYLVAAHSFIVARFFSRRTWWRVIYLLINFTASV